MDDFYQIKTNESFLYRKYYHVYHIQKINRGYLFAFCG